MKSNARATVIIELLLGHPNAGLITVRRVWKKSMNKMMMPKAISRWCDRSLTDVSLMRYMSVKVLRLAFVQKPCIEEFMQVKAVSAHTAWKFVLTLLSEKWIQAQSPERSFTYCRFLCSYFDFEIRFRCLQRRRASACHCLLPISCHSTCQLGQRGGFMTGA